MLRFTLILSLLFVFSIDADAGLFRNRSSGCGQGRLIQRERHVINNMRERHIVVQRGCANAVPVEVIPAPTATPKKVSANDSIQDVLVCVNAERQRRGLVALALCPTISSLAQQHVERRGFIHSRLGYRENIARGQGSGAEAVGDWMNSPGHRANILAPGSRAGIGNVGDIWILCIE